MVRVLKKALGYATYVPTLRGLNEGVRDNHGQVSKGVGNKIRSGVIFLDREHRWVGEG